MSSDIKVILKTPAQKTEDQIINCNLDWTVLKLKDFISENNPLKPSVNDIRLIYSGHLLKNESTLRNVFQPTAEDNSTFTLHLVLNQKSSTETNKDETQSTNENTSATSTNLNQFSFNLTNGSPNDFAYLYAQQMQQYQQMYVNYMTQYLSNSALGSNQPANDVNSNLIHSMNALSIMNSMFLSQFNPVLMPNLTSPTSIILNNNPTIRTNTQQSANDNAARLNDNQDANEDDIDLQHNWLDIFWNIIILFSLTSSSISRTLVLIGISFVYYLYKAGFFRLFFSFVRTRFVHNLLRNVNFQNNNRNNLPNEEQLQNMMDNLQMPGLRTRRAEQETQATQATQETQATTNSNENAVNDVNANDNQNSILDKFRFLYMIISSLFLSLMPHNGPINIPAN